MLRILILLFGLMVVGVGAGLAVVQQQAERTGGILGSKPVSPTISAHPMPTSQSDVSPGGVIPEGWRQYVFANNQVSWWYPGAMEVTQTPEGDVRFLLTGETQTQGTELFDGMLILFSHGTYEAPSFETFVQNEYQQMIADPAVTGEGSFGPVNISGRRGYRFAVTGLGTFTHTYVPLGEREFMHIVYIVVDPTGKDYQGMVEAVFRSVAYQ